MRKLSVKAHERIRAERIADTGPDRNKLTVDRSKLGPLTVDGSGRGKLRVASRKSGIRPKPKKN